MSTRETSYISRVVEVLVDCGENASPRWVVGSGLLIGGRKILTSAHVLTGGHAVYVRAIRHANPGDEELAEGHDLAKHVWRASIIDAGHSTIADIALLDVLDGANASSDGIGDLPPLRFARVDRVSKLPQAIQGCSAVGFPKFMEYFPDGAAQATPARETAQVSGEIPTLDRLVSGLLTFRVKSSPRPLPPHGQAIHDSAWSGMSGAAVLADDVVIGVVTEHFPRAGDSQLTVTPITHIKRLSSERLEVWQQALGIDVDKLPICQASVEPMRALVKPGSRTVIVAFLAALTGGIAAGVLAGRFDWGFTFATMTLGAVMCGNAGFKLLRINRAIEAQSRQTSGSTLSPPSSAQPPARAVDITGNRVDIRGSVIAAGDVHQTNIKIGGFAALAVAGILALVGSLGTAAISNATDSPGGRSTFTQSPADATPSSVTSPASPDPMVSWSATAPGARSLDLSDPRKEFLRSYLYLGLLNRKTSSLVLIDPHTGQEGSTITVPPEQGTTISWTRAASLEMVGETTFLLMMMSVDHPSSGLTPGHTGHEFAVVNVATRAVTSRGSFPDHFLSDSAKAVGTSPQGVTIVSDGRSTLALSLTSGDILWKAAAGAIALGGATVVAAQESVGVTGSLGLALSDGRTLWSDPTPPLHPDRNRTFPGAHMVRG